jgi:hypothetical protein
MKGIVACGAVILMLNGLSCINRLNSPPDILEPIKTHIVAGKYKHPVAFNTLFNWEWDSAYIIDEYFIDKGIPPDAMKIIDSQLGYLDNGLAVIFMHEGKTSSVSYLPSKTLATSYTPCSSALPIYKPGDLLFIIPKCYKNYSFVEISSSQCDTMAIFTNVCDHLDNPSLRR